MDPNEAINDRTITVYTGTRRRIVEHIQSLPTRRATAFEISRSLGISQTTVSSVLSALRDKRYTSCVWIGREKCTDAFILDRGKEFIDSWLDVVEDTLAGGHTQEAIMRHIEDARAVAGKAAMLYFPFSKKGRSKPFEERLTETLRFIGERASRNGIGPRTMEIVSATGVMCSNLLQHALKQNLIERETEGKGTRWRLTAAGRGKIASDPASDAAGRSGS